MKMAQISQCISNKQRCGFNLKGKMSEDHLNMLDLVLHQNEQVYDNLETYSSVIYSL